MLRNKESEGEIVLKGNGKKLLSCLLSAVTVLSAFLLQPVDVQGADLETAAYEAEYPALEKIKEDLKEDEIVAAEDHEVEIGSDFDIEHDFFGMEFSSDKVKIIFHEAKNESGQAFDSSRADIYKAVYFVEPVSKNPSYHISRNIIVKEKKAVSFSEKQEAEEPEDGRNHSDGFEALPDKDESKLTADQAMMQAEQQDIDLMAMEAGESVTFYASAGASSMEQVTVTRGTCYRYADYGYGSYLTYKYTVQFGNISATAYCVQPSADSPESGTYSISRLKDQKTLAKICYYGTKASGNEGFFAEKHPDFSEGQRFILVHMAASYANGSGDAFSGASETGTELAMELYEYCMAQPEIPDVDMEFSDDSVHAYVDGEVPGLEGAGASPFRCLFIFSLSLLSGSVRQEVNR